MARQHPDDSHRDTRRRFEQWARNSQCSANTISAVHNIPMNKVALHEGVKATMGQSPFALARGQQFERLLYSKGGEPLYEQLRKHKVVPESASGLADFRLRINGGRLRGLDDALAATSALLKELAGRKSRPDDPWLVASATVRIPGGVMLPEAMLVLDSLVIGHDTKPRTLMVGEIKTYPDRGGYTDPAELATARAQAGVYVHGLDLVLAELGLAQQFTVLRTGFLVLSRPGFNRPSVRAGEDLRYQAERAKRGFELLRATAASLPVGENRPGIDDVSTAEYHYCEACVSFCDRAPVCRARAEADGDGAILGDDVDRFLGSVPLQRALELLGGAQARTEAEQDLARRMAEVEALRTFR
jgi:hypothetical protein